MSGTRIDKYQASWHLQNNVGLILIWDAARNHQRFNFTSNNVGLFTAVLQILQGDDDPYLVNGCVTTGPEDPGPL